MRIARFFSLTLRHRFWGGRPPPLHVVPVRETADGIAALGGVIKAVPGGLICGVPEGADPASLDMPLPFDVVATDPVVASVTEGLGTLGRAPIFPVTVVPQATDTVRLSSDSAETLVTRPDVVARLLVTADAAGRELSASVEFDSVARIWTYNVIGGDAGVPLSVRDTAGAVRFEAAAERTLPTGAVARCFRSADPIRLRERPEERFELVSEGPFGPRTLVPLLPAPAPTALRKDPASGAITSDIYVTL
ncbi:MAG: hypothetical protein AAFQ51_14595 [Pseudomonadota bacterium]